MVIKTALKGKKMADLSEIRAKYPLGGRPKAFNSAEEMVDKMHEYLASREQRVVEVKTSAGVQELTDPAPITIESFCVFAGITKTTFYDYGKKPKYKAVINQFKQIVESYFVDQCVEGKPGNKADFVLKNGFADEWKDKKDLDISGDAVAGIVVNFTGMASNDREEEENSSHGNTGSL